MLDDCVVGTICKGETEGDKKNKKNGKRRNAVYTKTTKLARVEFAMLLFCDMGGVGWLVCAVDVLRELAFLFCSRDWVKEHGMRVLCIVW